MNWKVLICFAAVGVFAAGAASAKAHHHKGHGKAHHELMAKENYSPPAQAIAYDQVDAYVHPVTMEKPMPMKAVHHGRHHAKATAAAKPAT